MYSSFQRNKDDRTTRSLADIVNLNFHFHDILKNAILQQSWSKPKGGFRKILGAITEDVTTVIPRYEMCFYTINCLYISLINIQSVSKSWIRNTCCLHEEKFFLNYGYRSLTKKNTVEP